MVSNYMKQWEWKMLTSKSIFILSNISITLKGIYSNFHLMFNSQVLLMISHNIMIVQFQLGMGMSLICE